jgi:hypothetical protein
MQPQRIGVVLFILYFFLIMLLLVWICFSLLIVSLTRQLLNLTWSGFNCNCFVDLLICFCDFAYSESPIFWFLRCLLMADFWRLFGVCRCTIPIDELRLSSTATPSQFVDQVPLPFLFQIRWLRDALSKSELQSLWLGLTHCSLMESQCPLYLSLASNPGIRRYSWSHSLRITISRKIKYDGRWYGVSLGFLGTHAHCWVELGVIICIVMQW